MNTNSEPKGQKPNKTQLSCHYPLNNVKEKNSLPNPGGVFALAFTLTSFFAHAPVSALWVLTRGPFFVSTHVDDPTTGVGTVGRGDLTLTGRGRQGGLLVVSSGGGRHQYVVG